jgi:CheY-specific phosphatase CheX
MITDITLDDVLFQSAEEIFETMIFMPLEHSSDMGIDIQGDTITSSILFRGTYTGGMAIRCTTQTANSITISMLAMEEDEEVSTDDMHDAMSELANLVMGCVKTRVLDAVGDLRVSIPSIVNNSQASEDCRDSTDTATIVADADSTNQIMFSLWYR